MNMVAIGTMVIANDGFTKRLGQVADIQTDRWGTHHVVVIDGVFENVPYFGGPDALGIGWKIATQAEIARAQKWAAYDKKMSEQ